MESKRNHLMLDFETLSANNNIPALLSVGAVIFDPHVPSDFLEFYREIDVQSSVDLGGEISIDTVRWWCNQSFEAKQIITKPKEPIKIEIVFQELYDFCKNNKIKYVWSQGLNFDIIIAENYFKKLNIKPPWLYYNAYDTRTLYNFTGITKTKFDGVKHNALDDARMQTIDICRCFIGFRNLMEKIKSIPPVTAPPLTLPPDL